MTDVERERDRCRGALVGLACGDAVGTTLEFRRPGTFAPVADLVGGGPFALKPGEWTDDTSMALCLAESLAELGRFDPADQMRRYVRWWRDGHLSVKGYCFDVGNTVRAALARFEAAGDPHAGSPDPHAAGNGSLMRLAPVPVYFRRDPATAPHWAAESSRATHAAPACLDACRHFAGLLVAAVAGASRAELLAAVAAGPFELKSPPQVRGTGYVVDCLEAALWAFASTDDFRSAVLAAANLGDDADTTAAVCGQLAGAYYGESGIPAGWRSKLAMWDTIDRLADAVWRGPAA